MLTGPLLRARVRGRAIEPQYIKVDKPSLVEHATNLVEIMTRAADQRLTRGQIDAEFRESIGADRSQRLLQGLAKLLLDRCAFDVQSPVEPSELRARAFACAAERGPLALVPGPFGRPTSTDILHDVGKAFDLTADQVGEFLFADLDDAKRMSSWRPLTPDALLKRYNVALVQALLLRCERLQVTLHNARPERIRQLLRYAKFHQLMHRADRQGDTLNLMIDGPTSLFRQSTKYGRQLALFFPCLPLQTSPWTLEATVLWTKAKHRKDLVVSHEDGLVSHYVDRGSWVSQEQTWFLERFAEADTRGWTLSTQTEPLTLGGRGVLLPDAVLERDGERVSIEIVGFWRRDWLERRLEGLRRHGGSRLILAVSKKLQGATDKLDGFPGEVVSFTNIIPIKSVLDAADRLVGHP
ncbi:MAG: DUF790 family protein [Myxococcota bacterium]